MEKLIIENFACLDKVEIEFNKINLFIGKQASGKSITAKLHHFFREVFTTIYNGVYEKKTKREIDRTIINDFELRFPSDTWANNKFEIRYEIEKNFISLSETENNKIKISYSENIQKLFISFKRALSFVEAENNTKETYRFATRFDYNNKCEEILKNEISSRIIAYKIFIPAGRSFFANLQSTIFTFLSSSNAFALDPFLIEFGSFYENMKEFSWRNLNGRNEKLSKEIDLLSQQILGATFHREKDKDYLIHDDKRKIKISHTSSGQQETLPLILILKSIALSNAYKDDGAIIYIEEPEAHLFPEAQKRIVQLISLLFNISPETFQIVLTTHSPYILSSFNNLLEAGVIENANGLKSKKKLYDVIPKNIILNHSDLNAYEMKEGKVNLIMDKDTSLINSSYIDSVSELISIEFDNLLELI